MAYITILVGVCMYMMYICYVFCLCYTTNKCTIIHTHIYTLDVSTLMKRVLHLSALEHLHATTINNTYTTNPPPTTTTNNTINNHIQHKVYKSVIIVCGTGFIIPDARLAIGLWEPRDSDDLNRTTV